MKNKEKYLVVAGTLALAFTAHSQVIVDFNSGFTLDTTINGVAASQPGLTGNWAASGTNTVVRNIGSDFTNSFALPQTGTAGRVLSNNSNDATVANISATLATPITTTSYFSFLGRMGQDTARIGITFNSADVNVNNGFNLIAVGQGAAGSDIRLRDGSTNVVTANSTGADTGLVAFYVGSIEWSASGNETFKLWVNPDTTDLNFLDSTPLLSASTNIGSALTTIGAFGWSSNPTYAVIDNLRVGTELGDVSIIPEPTTAALILGGVALSVVILLRPRKKSIRQV